MAKFTVLMSACLSNLTASQNMARTGQLATSLTEGDLGFVRCIGVYKGVSEFSMAIPCNDHYNISQLKELAREFEQESILVIDNETKEAHLVELECGLSIIVPLGKWTKTTWNDCKYNHDNYTYFPEANVYYVCRP